MQKSKVLLKLAEKRHFPQNTGQNEWDARHQDTILAAWWSHGKTEQFSRSNNNSVCSELTLSFNIHYLPSHNPAMHLRGWWWRWLFYILYTISLCATGWSWICTPPALASGMLGLQVCATITDYDVLCFLFPFSSVFMCCAWVCACMFCMYMVHCVRVHLHMCSYASLAC